MKSKQAVKSKIISIVTSILALKEYRGKEPCSCKKLNQKFSSLTVIFQIFSQIMSRETRIWVDGCFDLGHFGHANLLRQAKALGGSSAILVVGVHTDAEIKQHKRPPIFNEFERCKMIGGVKYVDEVHLGAPYLTTPQVIEEYNCDFCVHGNDITVSNEGELIEVSLMKKLTVRTPI